MNFYFDKYFSRIITTVAMKADLRMEELSSTIKSNAMKDTAQGPDGIPYSVYNKLWVRGRTSNTE